MLGIHVLVPLCIMLFSFTLWGAITCDKPSGCWFLMAFFFVGVAQFCCCSLPHLADTIYVKPTSLALCENMRKSSCERNPLPTPGPPLLGCSNPNYSGGKAYVHMYVWLIDAKIKTPANTSKLCGQQQERVTK